MMCALSSMDGTSASQLQSSYAIQTPLPKNFSSPRHLPSRKLTRKPKKGPLKTTVPLKGGYMGFHVSLGECTTSLQHEHVAVGPVARFGHQCKQLVIGWHSWGEYPDPLKDPKHGIPPI